MKFKLSSLVESNANISGFNNIISLDDSIVSILNEKDCKSDKFLPFLKGHQLFLKISLKFGPDANRVDKFIIIGSCFTKGLTTIQNEEISIYNKIRNIIIQIYRFLRNPKIYFLQHATFRSGYGLLNLDFGKGKSNVSNDANKFDINHSNNQQKKISLKWNKAQHRITSIFHQIYALIKSLFFSLNNNLSEDVNKTFINRRYKEIQYSQKSNEVLMMTAIDTSRLSPFDRSVDLLQLYIKQDDGEILGPCVVKFPKNLFPKMVYFKVKPSVFVAEDNKNQIFRISRSDGESVNFQNNQQPASKLCFDWLNPDSVRITCDSNCLENLKKDTTKFKTIRFVDRISGLKTEIPIILKQ